MVKRKIESALNELRARDYFLLEADTNERSITHKLAEYLQQEFPQMDVDCEYNRHGRETKIIQVPRDNVNWDDTEARTVFPDIIIHKRGIDESNLLVVEVKKSSNPQTREFDRIKLMAFTAYPYNYQFGLLLEISVNGKPDKLQWYPKNVNEQEKEEGVANGWTRL
jgi:hypothetical protein